MPRPRKPTRVLDLTGRLKHDKKRFAGRRHEPVDNAGLGGPPARMNEVQVRIWKEVAKQLVEGVALASDRRAFETMVRLLEEEERGEIDGKGRQALLRLYTMFGMNPSDRSRVSAPKRDGKEDNPFGKLG